MIPNAAAGLCVSVRWGNGVCGVYMGGCGVGHPVQRLLWETATIAEGHHIGKGTFFSFLKPQDIKYSSSESEHDPIFLFPSC